MASKIPHTELLLTMMGAPHSSDMTTTLFRLARAVLDRSATLQIWACGYATMLTHSALDECKPRNIVDWNGDYPSTAKLAAELLADYPGRVHWYACRFCSEERGVTAHIPEVRVRPAFSFSDHVDAADKTVFLGLS